MFKYHNERAMFVSQVQIVVSNLEKSLAFYTNILGLSIIKQEDNFAYLGVDGTNVLLVLREIKGAKPAQDNVGLYHFAFLLENKSSFAQLLNHLIEVQYPLTGLSDHGISEAIYLQDPDNNGIEVAVDRYDENGNVYKLNYFGPQRIDLDELSKHLPEEKFTKLPPSTILGHLHLHVSDMNEARKFFVEGLGFEVQFDYHGAAVFVSSQGYHHHLGLNTWNGKEAKRRVEAQAGLVSYVVNLPKEKIDGIMARLSNLGYQVNNMEVNDVNGDKIIFDVK